MPEDIRCPICGSETVERTATKGPNIGQIFHVCNRYPECKGKVAIAKLQVKKELNNISTTGMAKTAEELYREGYEAAQAKEYQRALELLQKSLSLEKNAFNRQVDRNIMGKVFEKQGDVEIAINLYEQNIAEDFMGDFPYDRLRIIYHRQKCFTDEVRVLEKAIKVFEEQVSPERSDQSPKLERFRQQLKKAKSAQSPTTIIELVTVFLP